MTLSSPEILAPRAQSFLFAEGGPISRKRLARLLESDEATLAAALTILSQKLEGTGIALVETETEIALAVAPQMQEAVEAAMGGGGEREIGDAGLEVLAILLYEGAATRAHIDYVRGVNSTSTIRTLLSRGLIERSGNPADGREFLYRPTTELLAHVGVTKAEELPDYATISGELAAFKAAREPFHGDTGTIPGESLGT